MPVDPIKKASFDHDVQDGKMKKRQQLLIIDDNEEVVRSLKVFLEQKYDVLTACNGIDGIQILKELEGNVDLVISDLIMPEISGLGEISIIKKKYPVVPISAITEWIDDIVASENKICADHLLKKPIDLYDLIKSIDEQLTGKPSKNLARSDLH